MQVEKELAELAPEKETFLTIGVFDGVHLGHRYLISRLIQSARERDWLSGVITFRQHPREVLSPRTTLPFLTNLTEKVNLLKNEGVDIVAALTFDEQIARLGARQFVGLLKKYLRMEGLLIGPDFALGQNREGDTETLRALGQDMGFSVTVISPMRVNGEVVSSTAIRKALAEGDMKRVTNLIGRSFTLQGRVTTGEGRGSQLGFPTANLDMDPKQALPADGVYATRVHIGDEVYSSATNIGWRPTFGANGRTVEVFILDYHGDAYGRELKIDIVERLRGEKRFESIEELKAQIAEDVKQGRTILGV